MEKQTHSTPKKKYNQYSDRLIPERTQIAPALLSTSKPLHEKKSNELYSSILKSELFGVQDTQECPKSPIKSPSKSVFHYKSPTKTRPLLFESPEHPKYSNSTVSEMTRKILTSPRKTVPQIPKTAYKVLDAPELQDDFYLNLVDWGACNMIAVGLGPCVYIWNAANGEVSKMTDLAMDDSIASVSWNQKGNYLSVGTNKGSVQLWDVQKAKKIRTFEGHRERVGTSAWNGDIISSGSRDRNIHHRDIRSANDLVKTSSFHMQEVCGLKWNTMSNFLASGMTFSYSTTGNKQQTFDQGGNDNKLLIWDWRREQQPIHKFTDHCAAVKAISWCPTQSNLVASGGIELYSNKSIRFWNTNIPTGNMLKVIDTGSQVCNLSWSRNGQEIVSTHGYSQNQVNIWKYESMETTAELVGHTMRVLYLSTSPDGQNIVTGAGDETLRFWNVFSKSKIKNGPSSPFLPYRMR